MANNSPNDQTSSFQKRRREEAEIGRSASQARPERFQNLFQSKLEANTAFWESLSEVHLHRSALRELDRRNQLAASQARPCSDTWPGRSVEPEVVKSPSSQIKRYSRQGGPDLSNVRGYPGPALARQGTYTKPSTNQTYPSTSLSGILSCGDELKKRFKSSAYHPNFEQHLIDHGIYPYDHPWADKNISREPLNLEKIRERIYQRRPSLSEARFSKDDFEKFQDASIRARTERSVMQDSFPTISGGSNSSAAWEVLFGNLRALTDGTLVTAKPDLYHGSYQDEIDRHIRVQLSSYIIPSTQPNEPALPNFFLEGKGLSGSEDVARRQACYDGAIGARGIHQLRSFGVEASETEMCNNEAYTIVSTYNSQALRMYTVHPAKSPEDEGSIVYYMTMVGAWLMVGDRTAFERGAAAFRNAADWAKEQRTMLIAAANTRTSEMSTRGWLRNSLGHGVPALSTTEAAGVEAESPADELSLHV